MITLQTSDIEPKLYELKDLKKGDTVIATNPIEKPRDLAVWLIGQCEKTQQLFGVLLFSDEYPFSMGDICKLSSSCRYKKVNIELVLKSE